MMRRWRSPESLLLPIGEALAQLVCEEDFADVKACEDIVARWCSPTVRDEQKLNDMVATEFEYGAFNRPAGPFSGPQSNV